MVSKVVKAQSVDERSRLDPCSPKIEKPCSNSVEKNGKSKGRGNSVFFCGDLCFSVLHKVSFM